MITYLLDPTAELLKSYPPPFKGTWKTLPSHLLPDDTLQDASNVTLLSGKLRSRLGLKLYNLSNFTEDVIGSYLFIGSDTVKKVLASTKSKLFKYFNSSFVDMTGTVSLSNEAQQVKMTSIQIGTKIYLLYTNGVDALKYSEEDFGLNNIVPLAGSIPVCKDICTSASRIVGITPPYIIQWCDVLNSNYLSFTNWPSLNQVALADTEDSLVALKPLGTLNIAIYKEGNIFVATAQTGPQSSAFRFDYRGEYEGPGGIQSIVSVNGTHLYMTPTGRVGVFDGSSHGWVCDGIWPFLQDDLDTEHSSKVFGVYNYQTSEVTFWYPRRGDNGLLKGILVIDIPYPLAGIQSYSYFLGNVEFECSNGLSVRLFQAKTSPLVFRASSSRNTFVLDKDTYTDNSRSFECSLTTPLFRPTPPQQLNTRDKGDIYKPILELYAERDETRGLVDISFLTSSNLETDGRVSDPTTIDLTKVLPNEYIGSTESGSYLGMKAEWKSTSRFEYKGADVYGRRLS